MDIEAGDPQRLFQRLTQGLGGGRTGGRGQDGELVLADSGQQGVRRESGGQARAQGGQHQIGAFVTQRLVQAAQAVEVGHHQLMLAGALQAFARAGDETLAVEQAGEAVQVGGGELDLGRDHAGGAQAAFLKPDAAPDADPAAAHAQTYGDLRARFLDAQHILGQRPIRRQGQGADGRG